MFRVQKLRRNMQKCLVNMYWPEQTRLACTDSVLQSGAEVEFRSQFTYACTFIHD